MALSHEYKSKEEHEGCFCLKLFLEFLLKLFFPPVDSRHGFFSLIPKLDRWTREIPLFFDGIAPSSFLSELDSISKSSYLIYFREGDERRSWTDETGGLTDMLFRRLARLCRLLQAPPIEKNRPDNRAWWCGVSSKTTVPTHHDQNMR